MKKFLIIMSIALAAFFAASCEKDSSQTPVPPPAESLAVDLSTFQAPATKAGDGDDDFFSFASTQVIANWLNIFQNIIYIPVEAYKQLLIASTPTQDGKGWTWTVEYTDAFNQKYTVTLYGENKGDTSDWEIRVSKDGLGGYEDYAWVTGWSKNDGSCGRWDVKVSPTCTDLLVSLEWTADNDKVQTVQITYRLEHFYLGISSFFNSSYIIYSASATDPAYDSTVEAHYNQNSDRNDFFWTVKIEWNSQTGAGRVSSQNNFGDGGWHCWDPSKEDI